MRLGRLVNALVAVILMVAAAGIAALAESAPMLTLRNASAGHNEEVQLTEADLLNLPQVTITTNTEWTDGPADFTGPLARDVVKVIGIGEATEAHMVAANDYSVDIPLEDFMAYDVVLAMFQDGERLTLRDKGPIWVMYPIGDHPELDDPLTNTKMIWQLTTIELR